MTQPPLCACRAAPLHTHGAQGRKQGCPLWGAALCGKGSGGGLCNILHEAVEDGGDLCSCGIAGGQEAAVGAVDQLLGEGPAERGFGVGRDLRGVGEAVQACAGGGAILLVLRVAVEDRSHLLAGDVGVRRERRGAGAVDDTVVGGPGDGVLIVGWPSRR